MFKDRQDAGRQLGEVLEKYKGDHPIVLAIPRGGVPVGYEVAVALKADFSLIVVRKLPFPDNPESGFGAIAEDGSLYLHPEAKRWVSPEESRVIIEQQKKEMARRIMVLRRNEPLPDMTGRTTILVDDGLAMGSTTRAAILLCKNREAGKIVVASPVAGPDVARDIAREVDDIVVLMKPPFFRAVAEAYRQWYDLTDKEVLDIMARWRKQQKM